jgi:hypothetical protein
MSSLVISKAWAMPNRWTFEIKPIKELINRYVGQEGGAWLNPFAGKSRIGITNDLDIAQDTEFHLDALDFLKNFDDESVTGVLYDPPYSPRQVSEVYKKFGMAVNMQTTQASYWRKQKDEIARILKPFGVCIGFGWSSNGVGNKRGMVQEEILLVAHGSNHNDTIVTVERKVVSFSA